MTNHTSAPPVSGAVTPPYPGKTNQDVINAFGKVDPTFGLLLACYGPWETNGLAIPQPNRDLPYRGPRVPDLRTPANADHVKAEALALVEAQLASPPPVTGALAGIGVWSYCEAADSVAIKARVQQAIDSVLRLHGNTVLWKVGDFGHLYMLYDVAAQMIHGAGLRPMAWLVNQLMAPAAEAEVVRAAFHSGYAGVIFDYESSRCFNQHAAAAQLASRLLAMAQQGEIDLKRLYLCCYPNLTDKINEGLPVQEVHAVCEGGMMPMTYGEFFFGDSPTAPADQARRVFSDWAVGHYQKFLADNHAPERPLYRILGLYHQRSGSDRTVVPMTAAEARPWLDKLAEFRQPFWSIWEPQLITPELYDLLNSHAALKDSLNPA